jgi:hypothetical protein
METSMNKRPTTLAKNLGRLTPKRRKRQALIVYHGTNQRHAFVKAGCYASLAEAEAIGYAGAADAFQREGDLPESGEMWVLTLRVSPSQVAFVNGQGDSDFDGQHCRLLADVPVISERLISQAEFEAL